MKKKLQNIFYIVVFILMIFGFYWSSIRNAKIEENGIETLALLKDVKHRHKGKIDYVYEFSFRGKTYESETRNKSFAAANPIVLVKFIEDNPKYNDIDDEVQMGDVNFSKVMVLPYALNQNNYYISDSDTVPFYKLTSTLKAVYTDNKYVSFDFFFTYKQLPVITKPNCITMVKFRRDRNRLLSMTYPLTEDNQPADSIMFNFCEKMDSMKVRSIHFDAYLLNERLKRKGL